MSRLTKLKATDPKNDAKVEKLLAEFQKDITKLIGSKRWASRLKRLKKLTTPKVSKSNSTNT